MTPIIVAYAFGALFTLSCLAVIDGKAAGAGVSQEHRTWAWDTPAPFMAMLFWPFTVAACAVFLVWTVPFSIAQRREMSRIKACEQCALAEAESARALAEATREIDDVLSASADPRARRSRDRSP